MIRDTEDFPTKKEKREILANKEQNRKLRKKFSERLFWFISIYLGLVLLILFLCGCSVLPLSDSILLMLLGTTTANVLGLFAIVAKYLFHNKNDYT